MDAEESIKILEPFFEFITEMYSGLVSFDEVSLT